MRPGTKAWARKSPMVRSCIQLQMSARMKASEMNVVKLA
jgi:hypothetical protein